jgi:hypothetical protein
MKHKKLKTCGVLLLGLGLQAIQAQTMLYVKEKSGAETTFILSGIRKILFTDNNMEISKTNASSQNFVLSDLRKLHFSDNTSGIDDKKAEANDKLKLYFNSVDGNLQINYVGTLNANSKLMIFNLHGQGLLSIPMQSNQTNVNLSAFKSGIYLCHVQNNSSVITRKFIKN